MVVVVVRDGVMGGFWEGVEGVEGVVETWRLGGIFAEGRGEEGERIEDGVGLRLGVGCWA